MKRFFNILIVSLLALAVSWCDAWAEHPIASAKFTDSGMIHVTLNDGREFDVPDDPANRHRRMVAEWVAEGNPITPADPPPVPTRREKIRSDPDFPKPSEFMEAFMDCRFNADCTAALALRDRLTRLRAKYP